MAVSKPSTEHAPTWDLHFFDRMPDVPEAIDNGVPLHWTQDARDAFALAESGFFATSEPLRKGRTYMTVEQTGFVLGLPLILLWVNRDPVAPAEAAVDALRRYNLLLTVGVPAFRMNFVRARRGRGAADHIERHWIGLAQVLSVEEIEGLARAHQQSAPFSEAEAV